MTEFLTIRGTAKKHREMISEAELRRRVKKGICPGVYYGSRFMVNVDMLQEQLDAESRQPKEANA